jgi:aminocarboxymuconate-semialdehyde decarboxylase
MSKIKQLLIDVHTHCYLPRYAAFLRQRTSVPLIFKSGDEERLLILDDEPATGRPVGPQVSLTCCACISYF